MVQTCLLHFYHGQSRYSSDKFINKNEAYKPEQIPYQLELSNTFISDSGLFLIYCLWEKKNPNKTKPTNLQRYKFKQNFSLRYLVFLSYLGSLALSQSKAWLRQIPPCEPWVV